MCEGSEVSPQLQAKCRHFCWHKHEIPRSETKDFILHCTASSMRQHIIAGALALKSHGQTQVDACKYSGLCPRRGTLSSENLIFMWAGSICPFHYLPQACSLASLKTGSGAKGSQEASFHKTEKREIQGELSPNSYITSSSMWGFIEFLIYKIEILIHFDTKFLKFYEHA